MIRTSRSLCGTKPPHVFSETKESRVDMTCSREENSTGALPNQRNAIGETKPKRE